jgi:putative Holliday junction resolvase
VADGDYLGLDVGQKRTGIARASSTAKLPQPLKIVETDKLIDELKALVGAQHTLAIVVGLPRNLEGDDTSQTRWVRQWAEQARQEIDLPLHFQDEALTTTEALSRQPNNSQPDAEAAAIILQDFLNGKD